MSPYLSEIYKWGEEYTEAAMQKESSLQRSQYPVHVTIGFHSYRRLKDAESACHSSMIIVKCIIPKGSYYWTGNDYRVNSCSDKGYAQYCSDRIRIVAWKRKARGAKWIGAEDAKRLKSYFQPGVNPE